MTAADERKSVAPALLPHIGNLTVRTANLIGWMQKEVRVCQEDEEEESIFPFVSSWMKISH